MQISQTEWSQVSEDWLRQESGVTEVENPVKVSSKQRSRLGEATEQVKVAGLERKKQRQGKKQIQEFFKSQIQTFSRSSSYHCGYNNKLVKSGACDQVFKQQQGEEAINVDDQQVLDGE